MRASVPTMSTPGVYAPNDEDPVTVEQVQTAMDEDQEVKQAIDDLVFSLEHNISKAKCFDAFEERMFALYLRNRTNLERS